MKTDRTRQLNTDDKTPQRPTRSKPVCGQTNVPLPPRALADEGPPRGRSPLRCAGCGCGTPLCRVRAVGKAGPACCRPGAPGRRTCTGQPAQPPGARGWLAVVGTAPARLRPGVHTGGSSRSSGPDPVTRGAELGTCGRSGRGHGETRKDTGPPLLVPPSDHAFQL